MKIRSRTKPTAVFLLSLSMMLMPACTAVSSDDDTQRVISLALEIDQTTRAPSTSMATTDIFQ